jgi:hypothetical protein
MDWIKRIVCTQHAATTQTHLGRALGNQRADDFTPQSPDLLALALLLLVLVRPHLAERPLRLGHAKQRALPGVALGGIPARRAAQRVGRI